MPRAMNDGVTYLYLYRLNLLSLNRTRTCCLTVALLQFLTPSCGFTVDLWLSPAVQVYCRPLFRGKFLPVPPTLRLGINFPLLPSIHVSLFLFSNFPDTYLHHTYKQALSPSGLPRCFQSRLSLSTAASKPRCRSAPLATLTRSASRKSAHITLNLNDSSTSSPPTLFLCL